MLVLTRKIGEKILIGDDIELTILDIRGDGIRVGIDAPRGIKIQRDEVVRAVEAANREALQQTGATDEQLLASLQGRTRDQDAVLPGAVLSQ
ncbi:MAG: carbon storage regulator [Microbacteriaceae bacterium]|jgi:carbon storage regulator|nr:carbon storage regulator [Microbacteriaceae bacterium]